MKELITIAIIILILKFTWGHILDFVESFFERFPKVRLICIGIVLLLFTILISSFGATSVGSFIGLFFTNALTVGIVVFAFWFLTSEKMAELRKSLGMIAIVAVAGGYIIYTLVVNAISATSMGDFITSEIASLLTPVAVYFIFKFLNSDAFVILTTKYNCSNCIHYKDGKCSLNDPDIIGDECSSYIKGI